MLRWDSKRGDLGKMGEMTGVLGGIGQGMWLVFAHAHTPGVPQTSHPPHRPENPRGHARHNPEGSLNGYRAHDTLTTPRSPHYQYQRITSIENVAHEAAQKVDIGRATNQ